jgi:integrase
MATMVGKIVAKKLFKETAANKMGTEDPYFESVPASRLGFKKKKTKALPPGLTKDEARVLTKAKRRAYRLDLMFGACGLKFGLSALIGLIPG